jgi:hypothetical protein
MIEITLPNGRKGIKAIYNEQFIPEYEGNPFIEALPQICTTEQIIDKLSVYPTYDESERFLEKQYRVHIIQRVFQCFQPLMIHLDIESKISRIIRQGYIARNPFNPKYTNRYIESYDDTFNCEFATNELFFSTGLSLTILGISGIGKTTAINRILSMYPQIIVHSKYKDSKFSVYQLPYLKIDTPHDGSLKGLCIDFFLKVDSLLGTNYYCKYGQNRLSANAMLPVMAKIAINTGLGVLIIDEIQNLNSARSGGIEMMLNFFVKLSNLGIPSITIGNPSAMPVFQSKFRQARRGSGQGAIVWDRMTKDENWDLLINAIWDYQWTRKITTLNKEISDLLYHESQGITDIAVKLFVMTQIRAIMLGTEEISTTLIKQTADENLKLVKPMIDALKNGDSTKIAKYEDISTSDNCFFNIYDKGNGKASLQKKMDEMKQYRNIENENVVMNENNILKSTKLNENSKNIESFHMNDEQQISRKNIKKRKASDIKCRDENDIRGVVHRGKNDFLSAHESLLTNGIIKDFYSDIFTFGEIK